MLRSRLSIAAVLALTFSISRMAIATELTGQQATAIENSARRIGETVIDQGHSASDVRKIVTFYVQGEVARALHPDMPEAPLPADESGQVNAIVDKVMSSLHVDEPVDPKPTPLPKPEQPSGPVNPPDPRHGPGPQPGNQPGSGPQPVIVWVMTPVAQPAPIPWPAPVPTAAFVPGFAPPPAWPGGAPTIHIKHGWFGHPDKVWYSRH